MSGSSNSQNSAGPSKSKNAGNSVVSKVVPTSGDEVVAVPVVGDTGSVVVPAVSGSPGTKGDVKGKGKAGSSASVVGSDGSDAPVDTVASDVAVISDHDEMAIDEDTIMSEITDNSDLSDYQGSSVDGSFMTDEDMMDEIDCEDTGVIDAVGSSNASLGSTIGNSSINERHIDSVNQSIVSTEQEIAKLTVEFALAVNDVPRWNRLDTRLKQLNSGLANLNAAREMMEKRQKSHLGEPNRVPSVLPKIQWKGHSVEGANKSDISADLKSALRRFSDSLNMHGINLDGNWRRIMPNCLVVPEHRTWFDDQLSPRVTTYSQFKTAFTKEFGVDRYEERNEAANALMKFAVLSGESFDDYKRRFYDLKSKAGESVKADVMANLFLRGTPKHIEEALDIAFLNWSTKHKKSLTRVVQAVQNVARRHWRRGNNHPVVRGGEPSNSVAQVDQGVKKWQQFANNSNGSNVGQGKKKCTIHPNDDDHDTKGCPTFAAAKRDVNEGSSGGSKQISSKQQRIEELRRKGLCFRCEEPFVPGAHTCDKTKLKRFRAMRKGQKGKIHKSIDKLLLESNLPLSNDSTSSYVPVTVEGIQVFGLIDTAASFSAMQPRLFKLINKPLKRSNDLISLADKSTVESNGEVQDVEILYNGIELKHNFELFDFDSDASICIGSDLMGKLNIGLTGLATSWVPYEPAKEDPIDATANDNCGNDYPYGSVEEREYMMKEIQPLLEENMKIPIDSCCTLPGSEVELKIDESKYKYRRQYPIPHAYAIPVKEQVQKWLNDGVIEEANDADARCYQSPLLAVRKKDLNGEYGKKVRVVLDIRSINEVLIPSSICKFQLPLISELHDRMSGKTLFSVLDLTQCYHRFPMHPNSQKYVVFYHEGRQYKFVRAPFGISSVGSIVQRAISSLLADLSHFCQLYIDDIQLFTHNDMKYHTECLKEVISRLNKVGLILNNEKAHYAQTQVQALGFTISKKGLAVDPRKVSNVHEWPQPTTGKAVQRLLGFSGYLRSLIPMYATITQPLDELRNLGSLSKVWNDKHTTAFENLKIALTSTPVISPADFSQPFYVGTDGSSVSIGGICYQVIDKVVKYVAFASRVLSKSERNYSTTRRELLAVLFCFSKFRHWLLHAKFHLVTDHRCLLYMHSQSTPNSLMLAYYESIFSLDYDVTHMPGLYHILPDRLSRLFDITDADEVNGEHLSDEPVRLGNEARWKKVKKGKKAEQPSPLNSERGIVKRTPASAGQKAASKFDPKDPDISLMFRMCQKTKTSDKPELSEAAKEDLILKYHLLGHYGINQVEKSMRLDEVSWPNMRADISRVLAVCDPCQSYNVVTRVGYHPPRSENPWGPGQFWGIDLGTFGVTSAAGNNFILLIVDLFSRYVVLRAIPNKDATTIAQHLVDVMAILGVPQKLVSDNGAEVSNALLDKILEHLHVDKRLSNCYNPYGNSTTEAYIKSSKAYLMKRFKGCDDQWDLYLNSTMIALNYKYSRLHNTRPFTAQFFRSPNIFGDFRDVKPISSKDFNPDLLEAKIKEVQDIIIPALREKIESTQLKDHDYFMKTKRIVQPYPVNSLVMIQNVTRRSKTDPRYLGPYKVKAITKGGSYTLESTATGALLPRAVSTSQLKLISKEDVLPENDPDMHFEVLAVTDHRGDADEREYRVKWRGFEDDSEDTWEKIDSFDSLKPIKTYLKRKGLLDPSNVHKEKRIMQRYTNKKNAVNADVIPDINDKNNQKRRSSRRRRNNGRS